MAAAEPHLAAAPRRRRGPPDVRLVPGDAEDEEYEEPDPPRARAPAPASGDWPRLHYWAWRAPRRRPSAFLGGGGESLENEAAQLRERRKELAAARTPRSRARRRLCSRKRRLPN